MSEIDRLLTNSTRYAQGFSKGELSAPPVRRTAVVACMDARLEPAALLGLEEGDVHVIRNAGGVVTEDVIRSLAVSQQLLGTREILLIHHTDCGMARFSDDEIADAIERGAGARPDFALEAIADLESGLRDSLTRIAESPFIAYKEDVRGFVYEVETGRLRELR